MLAIQPFKYYGRETLSKRRGVYVITHDESAKIYIGSASKNFHHRWNTHATELRKGVHKNPPLQAAWNKYGEDAFSFHVMEECSREECVSREQYWMDRLLPFTQHFNISKTAGSCLGVKLSPEHCSKIGAAQRGRKHTEESKAKLSASLRARKWKLSPEHLAKMIAGRKPRTDAFRKSISDRMKGRIPWNKGMPMLPHVQEALIKANTGKCISYEQRAAISARHKGSKRTDEFNESQRARQLARVAAGHKLFGRK